MSSPLLPALALIGLACLAPAADLPPLPADTQWSAVLDVKAALTGEVGAWVHDILGQNEQQAKLAAFIAITGFDPLRDLDAVLVAGSAARKDAGVLALVGRFDQDRLVTLVRAAQGYGSEAYAGHTLHHWIDQGKPEQPLIHACFAGDHVLMLGNAAAALEHELDAIDGRAKALAAPAAGGAGIASLFMASAEGLQQWADVNPQAATLRNVKHGVLSLREDAGTLRAELTLAASAADTATQIRNVVLGLQAVIQLSTDAGTNTELGKLLVRNLAVGGDGADVRVTTSCPVKQLRDRLTAAAAAPPAPVTENGEK